MALAGFVPAETLFAVVDCGGVEKKARALKALLTNPETFPEADEVKEGLGEAEEIEIEPPDVEDVPVPLLSDPELLSDEESGFEAGPSPARFFLPSFLKSVSYQPPPFSRKARLVMRPS